MNIGIVLSKTPGYSETFFLSKIKGLQQSGYEVTLFVQQKAPDFKLCPVSVAPSVFKRNWIWQSLYGMLVMVKLLGYPKRLITFMRLEKEAKRSIKQSLKNLYNNAHILTARLDWVHFGFATMALQSEHVAKAIGAKMGVSFRGYDIDVYPLKHEGCYKVLWKHVDKVHSISKYLLDKAYTLGLSKTIPFQIITPAVDIKQFKVKHSKKQNKILQLLTIARLEWIKGLTYTIEALALLKQQGIEFHYIIIGDGKIKEELLFTIHQLGLEDDVILLSHIHHENVTKQLSSTEIYLQYSVSEGFCNAVLEAQATGVLCILSDGGALTENVINGQTGWIVPKCQPKLLTETLLKVLYLPNDQKKQIIQNAQHRVKQEFNLDLQMEQFAEFYNS